MAQTLKFGNGTWATKKGSTLAYNDQNNRYKPLPFTTTRASGATRVNKAGLIETVGSGEPRIDYKDNTKGALLLEPSRTNLITYSNGFDNVAWVELGQGIGSAPIVTPNYAISPDGTLNASRLQCDLNGGNTTNDRSWLYQSISTITGDNAFSLYVKNNSNEDITFSLTNGSSETVVVLSDDKWHRLSTVRSGGGQPRIGLIGGVGASDNADLLIYGAQLEQGSYATSYIPTSGSAVTRLADACNNGANEQVINSTEGVLYFETKGFINVPTFSRYIQLSKNGETGFNNSLVIQHRNNGFLRIYANGTDTSDVHFNIDIDFTQNHKIAVLYKLNGYKLFIDGVAQSLYLTPTQTVFSGLDTLSFDYRGTYEWNGSIKDVRVYNTALTDQELQALTQE
jgi:hypothetical protein